MEKRTVPQNQLPLMTLTQNELRFTSACSEVLGGLQYVYFLIHPHKKYFLLMVGRKRRKLFECPPVRWTEDLEHDDTGIAICKNISLVERMYRVWGLDRSCTYQAVGTLDSLEEIPMLLFDFNAAEKRLYSANTNNVTRENPNDG